MALAALPLALSAASSVGGGGSFLSSLGSIGKGAGIGGGSPGGTAQGGDTSVGGLTLSAGPSGSDLVKVAAVGGVGLLVAVLAFRKGKG